MIENLKALNSRQIEKARLSQILSARITTALKKSYGVHVLDPEIFHFEPKYAVSRHHSLTSSDLRTSLEAWAQVFSRRYLDIPLPTYSNSCVLLDDLYSESYKYGKPLNKLPENIDNRTKSTLKTYINSVSTPTIPRGYKYHSEKLVDASDAHTMMRNDSILHTQKKVQYTGSRWWSKPKRNV
ncbi:hypothetical protein BB560_000263 [Smittium megazygosporum]|uniref:Uncharacterized protein n=1 Tax=Smittium megazygosporum TaxID=133381 RepID=A0A2T9ZKV2_9FUNG|nr:hypothetical protein BB560_000263 [Smittium megazygosporum]